MAKKSEKAAATTRDLPSYVDFRNSNLIILTLIFILVAIQTSIPNISTKKVFPGCIKSFTGYPLMDTTDKSGIIYMACVANKVKSNIQPWSSIMKMGEKSIIKKMEVLIDKYIVDNKELKKLFRKKREYLLANPIDEIPASLNIQNWREFLPPLFPSPVKKGLIATMPAGATITSSKSKSKSKNERIDIRDTFMRALASKIQINTFEIVASIQEVADMMPAILTNNSDVPFLENSCCDESADKTTIEYFIEKRPSIAKNNDIATEISRSLQYLKRLNTASTLFYPFSTKIPIPDIATTWAETTIYRGVIHYCRFNTNIATDEEFKSVCGEKPMNPPINYATMTDFREIIDAYKTQGKNYSYGDFNALLNMVSKRGILSSPESNIEAATSMSNMEILWRLMADEVNDETAIYSRFLPIGFIERFSNILSSNNEGEGAATSQDKAAREMKNYLAREIGAYRTKIQVFMERNSKLSKRSMTSIRDWFDTIQNADTDPVFMRGGGASDNQANIQYYVDFMKNTINNILKVFPNIIINELSMRNTAPMRHWDLSPKHNDDIANIIRDYYERFVKLQENPMIKTVLRNVSSILAPLSVILDNLAYNPGKTMMDKTTILGLVNYIWFFMLNYFIDILENPIINNEIAESQEGAGAEAGAGAGELGDTVKIQISEMLNVFIEATMSNYRLINYNSKSIVDKIITAKEVEKTQITDYLKNMTDEEREIENIFKNNKLEKWSIGLQKGMTQYVAATYDEERERLETLAIQDRKLKTKATDMNSEIYRLDLMYQEALDAEIDADNNIIDQLPDDADGDEEAHEEYANYDGVQNDDD